MIDVVYLSARMSGPKRLKDKPHRDVSPVCRGRSSVVKVVEPVGSQVATMPRKVCNRKSSGMPVKLLIEQEMYKEVGARRKLPNVVARLMGLEALPSHHSVESAPRIVTGKNQTKNSYTIGEILQEYQQREDVYGNVVSQDTQPVGHVSEKRETKDAFEVCKQPSRNQFKDENIQIERCHGTYSEMKVALVHQKFLEAKHLAKNKKLLESKEFKDALEVLSSNKDIFLKFLEEPNLQSSRYLHEEQITPSNKTKYITVLKPSRKLDTTDSEQPKQEITIADVIEWGGDKPCKTSGSTNASNISKPVRIVVLKPRPKQCRDSKTTTSLCDSKTTTSLCDSKTTTSLCDKTQEPQKEEDSFEGPRTKKIAETREAAKGITRQMQVSLSSKRRDERLLSSETNGYTGDESSFSRSETIYPEEEYINFNDAQTVTPTSHHSWDYNNRLNGPYLLPSDSRASYSPESLILREAKMRLSERLKEWTRNEVNQEEYTQLQRSTSTLEEMLSISEIIRETDRNEESSNSNLSSIEHDPEATSTCSSSNRIQDVDNKKISCATLIKSKSTPSSSAYENTISDFHTSNLVAGKEETKSKNMKFSISGKFLGLLSSNKRDSQEKCLPSSLTVSTDEVPSSIAIPINKITDHVECVADQPQENSTCSVEETFRENLRSLQKEPLVEKEMSSPGKPTFGFLLSQNEEQPSPVSVLEALFEEEKSTSSSQSRESASLECHRTTSRFPLELSTRSLSWEDDDYFDGNISFEKNQFEVQEHGVDFIKKLLSSSSLDNETIRSALIKWYSLESPLNPLILENLMEHREEGAEDGDIRSRQRLLFDCVNVSLLEISQNDVLCAYQQFTKESLNTSNRTSDTILVADEVIKRVTSMLSLDNELVFDESENLKTFVIRVAKEDHSGMDWEDGSFLEIMEIGREIERQVLDELIAEAMI